MLLDLTVARESVDGWYRMDCPLCASRVGKEDHRQSFGVRSDSGYYHCFRCGAAGFVRGSTLQELPPRQHAASQGRSVMSAPPGFTLLGSGPGRTSMVLADARRYAARRVPEELWSPLQVGAVPEGYYAGRIIIPVLDEDGRWLGWVGRDWTGLAERPYVYPSGMRREALFNAAELRRATEEPVLLVEGVFDAIAYWPDACAFLGKPTRAHLEAVSCAVRPVAVVLDGDAHREGWTIAQRLRIDGVRAGSVRLPARVDPDEVDVERLRAVAREAIESEDGEAFYG